MLKKFTLLVRVKLKLQNQKLQISDLADFDDGV